MRLPVSLDHFVCKPLILERYIMEAPNQVQTLGTGGRGGNGGFRFLYKYREHNGWD